MVGKVNRNGAPNPVDGRKVVFYQSYPTVVRATVGPPFSTSGQFALNIYDNKLIDLDPTMDPNATYYVAVERDPTDNWGADPVPVTLALEGWNKVELNLEEGAGPGGTTEGPDDGLINETRIERMAEGRIKLYWNYNGATNADIWRMEAGTDSQFSEDTAGYDKLTAVPLTGTEWEDPDLRVADQRTTYYRVVPGGVVRPDIFGVDPVTLQAYNKRTVGKVDLKLGNEYNSVCYPFNSAYIDVPTLMGNQLSEGDQIHWWDQPAQTYRIVTKLSEWPAGHSFGFAEGFFIYLVPPDREEYLTLVGLVDNFAAGVTVPLGEEYTLIGYPFPVLRDAVTAGFAPRDGDQIHVWPWIAQAFSISTYVTGPGWTDLGMTGFSVGEGEFYYIPEGAATYNWAPIF